MSLDCVRLPRPSAIASQYWLNVIRQYCLLVNYRTLNPEVIVPVRGIIKHISPKYFLYLIFWMVLGFYC